MNSSIKSFSLLAVILLAGCSSPTSRIADCQAQGVSHDTCYLAEQQRQAAILSASEAQAFKNAEAAQHAQAAKKSIYKGFGVTFRMSSKNFAYLNDSLCAIDEDNADGHTQRPEQPDSRIFTDLFPGGERFDAQCGQNGEQQRPQ